MITETTIKNKERNEMSTKSLIEIKPRIAGVSACARKCGVTPVHIRYVLKGERKPSARLRRALRACGVTKRLDGSDI